MLIFLVSYYLFYAEILIWNFWLSRRSKTKQPNISWTTFPAMKLSELKQCVIRYPFPIFSLIDFLNSESFCLLLDMHRMTSNRFVSRSSRLIYFLTVSDRVCRSIIHFTDQTTTGSSKPPRTFFFATVRLWICYLRLAASCLLDFGWLVAGILIFLDCLLFFLQGASERFNFIYGSRTQGVAFLLICFGVVSF